MKKIVTILLSVLCFAPSFAQTMEWHIKNDYVAVEYMGNDLFKVKRADGRWGVFNRYGGVEIAPKFEVITPFVENRALALSGDMQCLLGIIDQEGRLIKEFNKGECYLSNYKHYQNGLLAYGVVANGDYLLFGYMNLDGTTVIRPQYYYAAPFFNEVAVIQYRSGNFGLINKVGSSVLEDNRKLLFVSTPVDGKSLICINGRKGNRLLLVKYENMELKELLELENGQSLDRSDYKSLCCGNTYYFDDAMRLISSSNGKTFNDSFTPNYLTWAEPSLVKVNSEVKLDGKTLFRSTYKNIEFCDDEYAIVTTANDKIGVLKLNPEGYIGIKSVPERVIFHHNKPVNRDIVLDVVGLKSDSKVKVNLIGINGGNDSTVHYISRDEFKIDYNIPISYFIPATKADVEQSRDVKVEIYLNDMLYKTENISLRGEHKYLYNITSTSPEFTKSDGTAVIYINVASGSVPSSSARVVISGSASQIVHFNGKNQLTIPITVTVPEDEEKNYRFNVSVVENDCPTYYLTPINKRIKHYDLQ